MTQAAAHWSAQFIGLPKQEHGRGRDGVDCWGLAWLIYGEVLGITLPRNDGVHPCAMERKEVNDVVTASTQSNVWISQDKVRAFDVLLLRTGRYVCHVGVAIDQQRMLHVHRDSSKVSRLSDPRWQPRLAGIYRHVDLVETKV